MNRADFEQLVVILHPLANLLPMGVLALVQEIGLGSSSLEVLKMAAAMGSGLALMVTYLAGRRMQGSVFASFLAAVGLGLTLGMWRAGSSGGVYGLSLLALAGAWWLAASYPNQGDTKRAVWLGVAAGLCVTTHLALITAVPALALVVIGLAGTGPDHSWARARAMAGFAAGVTTTSMVVWLMGAGIASGWRASGMLEWVAGSHVPVADPSAAIGWGLSGLGAAIAAPGGPGRLGGYSKDAATILAILFVIACFGRGVTLLVRADRQRVLGAALLCNAALAFVAASWYQSLRPDYFALGLIPLALLWPVGGTVLTSGRRRIGRRLAAVAIAPIAILGIWNVVMGVGPTMQLSNQRERAAETITEVAPQDSRLILSPSVMPFVAYAGLDAKTGWGALLETTGSRPSPGAAAPLVDALTGGNDPLLISSRSFDLLPTQESLFRVTESQLWQAFRSCCEFESIARFDTERGVETLYRVTPRA
jgi:hypothetical protein